MSEESQLQVTAKASDSSLSLSKPRSGLIARGRRDAEHINITDPDAQFFLGLAYGSGKEVAGDLTHASKWYRKAADQGHAEAQFTLAFHYLSSDEPQDHTEAACLWRKAADQGHAEAQFWLGTCYEDGEGTPQDYAEAVRWWRKAAEQGLGKAQFAVGVAYGLGQGVPEDYVLAHMWLNLSASNSPRGAENGPQDAHLRLWRTIKSVNQRPAEARDEVASEMTPGQIAEAQRLAREWKPKPGVESKSG